MVGWRLYFRFFSLLGLDSYQSVSMSLDLILWWFYILCVCLCILRKLCQIILFILKSDEYMDKIVLEYLDEAIYGLYDDVAEGKMTTQEALEEFLSFPLKGLETVTPIDKQFLYRRMKSLFRKIEKEKEDWDLYENKKLTKKVITETELRSIISNVINESEDVKQYIKEKQKQNILNSVKVDIHNLRTGIDSLLSSDFDLDDELKNYLIRIKEVL